MAVTRAWLRMIGALLLCGLLLAPDLAAAQSVPGFTDTLVVDIDNPTALAFLNGGPVNDPNMLLTSQSGELYYRASGSSNPVLVENLGPEIDDCQASEQGLLGLAVNPANTYVYLYYTHDTGPSCENRVVRYSLTLGDPPELSDRVTLIAGMPSLRGNHNGGDLQFGRDGLLYISVGEAGIPANAQRLSNLQGKILRITEAGGIPSGGNAFNGVSCANGPAAAGQRCEEIYAYGLRNPYRIALNTDPAGPGLFINDVGANRWEEIDRGVLGANYGWPRREGPCAQGKDKGKSCRRKPKGLARPVHAYKHKTGCRTITGGAFVPLESSWPVQYKGDYLFADFICGAVFRLDNLNGKKRRRSVFGSGFGDFSVVHLAFGPDRNTLYYLTRANDGELHRIVPSP